MTVYVDDMRAPYRGMVMCHMVADTDAELLAMADTIGVPRRWHQLPDSHFDICLTKRALAVAAGAVEITHREAGCMCVRRRLGGTLGAPGAAIQWVRENIGKAKK